MNNNKSLLQFCVRVLLTVSIVSGATLDGNGKIFDITHKISSESPIFDSKKGLGHFIWLVSSIKNGSKENASKFELGTHTGTHVDAPSHYSQQYYEEGFDVTTLSLQTLNGKTGFISTSEILISLVVLSEFFDTCFIVCIGPAIVVDVPRNHNITAEVMKSLNIPRGVHRVLFKTLNTDRRLMHKTEFASDFTGFTKDGAQWQSAMATKAKRRATTFEAEGKFKITAKVVPITEEDSRIHNYGITKEDCFAHLDLGFKFYSLSDQVNGVLGQTYKPGYVSHLNIGAKMPVMGGGRDFHSSNPFAPDCAVARFTGISEDHSFEASGMAGHLWLWQWH
ncbi:hypothetical protein GQ457_10G020630 [Hibiscus cannabinus]